MDAKKGKINKKQELEVDSTTPTDEKIYKYQSKSSVNLVTMIFLLITTFTAVYINMDQIKTTLHASKTRSTRIIRKSKQPIVIQNITLLQSPKNDTTDNILSNDITITKTKTKTETKKSKKNTLINAYDKKILHQINEGEQYFKQRQYPDCISFFEKLYKKYPLSPRAVYGQALCLDKLAEQMQSNEFLKKAIYAFGEVAKQPNVPYELEKLSVLTQAKRYIFLGENKEAILVLTEAVKRLQNDVELLNELGVAYMMKGLSNKAHPVFEKVLTIQPTNGFATVHIGFILKAKGLIKESIPYLLDGIQSEEPGTSESRFYFHLGDAYYRNSQPSEAWKIYHEAAEKGIFLSAEQRSTYNAETKLRAQPFWTVEETGYKKEIRLLEYHWKTIRDEALILMNADKSSFRMEAESLSEAGDWRQFEIYRRGKKHQQNCQRVPKTCELMKQIPHATSNVRGQIKYSIMTPGTHVWPHTGPTNCRLRVHIGLTIPNDVFIRVGSETKTWKNGKALIIDDSFEHEVWHNGTKSRMILIADFWHPDIPDWEKKKLSPI